MKLDGGIDLHSNNGVVALLDEADRGVYEKRLPNDRGPILREVEPHRAEFQGLVVESTFNWYWLVDGRQGAGYPVHLANTAGIPPYSGLKYPDDHSDGRWLAQWRRLGVLPAGYIYPPAGRAVRDLLRQRSQVVRQKVTPLLSLETRYSRHTGSRPSAKQLRLLTVAAVEEPFGETMIAQAINSRLTVMPCLEKAIEQWEQVVKAPVKLQPAFKPVVTVAGIGPILGLTIMLETGAIQRFPKVGPFASYCRCVDSQPLSNGKRQGQGNTQNGNPYLAGAFVEAANGAIRYHESVQRLYQRKCAKTRPVVARKAVAHKLARAGYYVLRDQVAFDLKRAFG